MELYDQHVHSLLSVDCDADPSDMVRRAIAGGLAGLAFTEHYDTHPSERDVCIYDIERISHSIESLRSHFGDRIFIGHGIEVCYQPQQMDEILAHLGAHEFDEVILAVHWFDGRALHERDHWEGLDAATATQSYLNAVLEAARFARDLHQQGQHPFDVLGHLDLVKRYTQRYFNEYDIRSYESLVDEILQTCLEADLVPELNLSTLRQSLPEPMPADWAIRRYAQLGGRAMAIGTDAHKPADVGSRLDEAVDLLRCEGIRYQAVFKGRQRYDIAL